ncbi:MAG TPA: hypothetical protein VN193_17755 [Candidatus Angelobacter sp.]|nr:hypothetical protein [Candidatus Angelobacter sp.]
MGKLVARYSMMSDRKYRDVWAMPFKSQEFARGPELVQHRDTASLRLDYETRTGAYAWKIVHFVGVSAVEFTAWSSCTPDQVSAYDRFVEVESSEWLPTLHDLPEGTHHFRVFFDDVGCYEVAATDLLVDDDGSRRHV